MYSAYGGIHINPVDRYDLDLAGHGECPRTYLNVLETVDNQLLAHTHGFEMASEEIKPADTDFLNVCQKPKIIVSEVSLGTKVVEVLDSPPVFPDVNIVPYHSINNKILIMLNSNSATYKANPIMMEPNDYNIFANHAVAQKLVEVADLGTTDIRNLEIEYKRDDFPAAFEIFRTTIPPLAYESFSTQGQKITVSNLQGETLVQTANSYVDTLVPNTKYWYTFRTVDVHGSISNPTTIYKVEIIDDGRSIFPVIEVYELPPTVVRTVTKPMRRYIKIAASSGQSSVDGGLASANDFLNNDYLGLAATTDGSTGTAVANLIWGEAKFKLRLTSKKTGKKLDINFSFNRKDTDASILEVFNQATAVTGEGVVIDDLE
tara:strand:- start:2744 stop:3868 length:1125 start_codon:yes stop_codon:yes gene_type:complete